MVLFLCWLLCDGDAQYNQTLFISSLLKKVANSFYFLPSEKDPTPFGLLTAVLLCLTFLLLGSRALFNQQDPTPFGILTAVLLCLTFLLLG
ncbi:hypothetical protein BCR42DRAFT_443099 [Absidia repens]|uniref:Uncharacterized protein n=1 Tax=Absidia repens TaxID=90262 RepID=A0A1X2I0G6_9FUNG|nr:hypothetical protein BCR42DRAFT_443099 [Absidia repens]